MTSCKRGDFNRIDNEIGLDESHTTGLSCAATASASASDIIVSEATKVTMLLGDASNLANSCQSSSITAIHDMPLTSSALLKFFEPPSATISKMKAKGWQFESLSPAAYQVHRLVGKRSVSD